METSQFPVVDEDEIEFKIDLIVWKRGDDEYNPCSIEYV